MLGSIVGDIVGSIYEFANIKTKDFEFFQPEMERTDDSILCIATADWLLHGGDVSHYYSRYALEYPYPMGGYGGMFKAWSSKVHAKASMSRIIAVAMVVRCALLPWAGLLRPSVRS